MKYARRNTAKFNLYILKSILILHHANARLLSLKVSQEWFFFKSPGHGPIDHTPTDATDSPTNEPSTHQLNNHIEKTWQ